jgi:hypothetical protein
LGNSTASAHDEGSHPNANAKLKMKQHGSFFRLDLTSQEHMVRSSLCYSAGNLNSPWLKSPQTFLKA